MSSPSNNAPPIHPQFESKLFTAPAEIRDSIYQYLIPDHVHLFIKDGEVKASECIRHKGDGDPDCFCRRTKNDDLSKHHRAPDIPYIRRLSSPWATHWRCREGEADTEGDLRAEHGTFPLEVLAACQLMTLEVIGYMIDRSIIHLNDLNMIEAFVSAGTSTDSDAQTWLTSTLLGHLLSNTKELHIDLRLPLEECKSLEDTENLADETSTAFGAWKRLPSVISCLPNLQRLRLWLDHEAPESWSLVNERAIFLPISHLGETSNLDIQVDLPKLHPKWESPERHFTTDSPAPHFVIHRRFRQRYHVNLEPPFGVVQKPDFPVLYGLVDWDENRPTTIDEVEAWEREIWKEGKDPMEEIGYPKLRGICLI